MKVMYNANGRVFDEEEATVKYNTKEDFVLIWDFVEEDYKPFSFAECGTIQKIIEMGLAELSELEYIDKALECLFTDREYGFMPTIEEVQKRGCYQHSSTIVDTYVHRKIEQTVYRYDGTLYLVCKERNKRPTMTVIEG